MASDFFYDKPDKKWNIEFESGGKLGNSDIYLSDGMQIHQALCSSDQLTFGACISDYATIKLINTGESYSGRSFTLTIEADGTACTIGQFKVLKEELSEDKSSRTVTAYDKMADILERDVAEWFNGITFPVTIRELRNSFCEFLGVEQAAGSWLLFDTLSVQKTISPQSMTGKAFLTKLCEMNGCFGHINPDGKMEYVYLDEEQQAFYLDTGSCIKETHEDYEAEKIDKLQIRTEENDIGCVYGTGENCYVIQDNFFFYGMNADELKDCATKIYSVISKLSYTPFTATCAGNPTFRPGECLRVPSKHGAYITYMMERVLKGTISLRDEYGAKGKRIRSEKANGVNNEIVSIKGKTAKLIRDVSGIISEVYDSETGTSRISQNAQSIKAEVIRATESEVEIYSRITANSESISAEVTRATEAEGTLSARITQAADVIIAEVTRATESENALSARITATADQISLKVSKGELSSEISAESGQIAIKSNRFSLESTNCTITSDGKIYALNCDLSGKITAKSGSIGGFTISDTAIYNGKSKIYSGDSGVYIGTDGISIGKLGTNPAVKITKDGEIEIKTSGSIDLEYGGNKMSLASDGITFGTITAYNTKITKDRIEINRTYIDKDVVHCATAYYVSSYYTDIKGNSIEMIGSTSTYKTTITNTGISFGDNQNFTIESNNAAVLVSAGTAYVSANSKVSIAAKKSGSGTPILSFFGATGSSKQTVNTATSTTQLSQLNALITALKNYGLIG